MSEIEDKYYRGEVIQDLEFNNPEGLVFFGKTVWEDHTRDRATAQGHLLDSGVDWQKVKPEVRMTPEQEYLCRPVVLNTGKTRTIPSDAEKLVLIREQLRREMAEPGTDVHSESYRQEMIDSNRRAYKQIMDYIEPHVLKAEAVTHRKRIRKAKK